MRKLLHRIKRLFYRPKIDHEANAKRLEDILSGKGSDPWKEEKGKK